MTKAHILAASGNANKMREHLSHVLDAAGLNALEAAIDAQVHALYELGASHQFFARTAGRDHWRQAVSRSYYGAYNVLRACRLKSSGHYSTDASDHHKSHELPSGLANREAHSIVLRNLRDDRNLCDYDHAAVESDLFFVVRDTIAQVDTIIFDSIRFLTSMGVTIKTMSADHQDAFRAEFIREFELRSSMTGVRHELKDRPDGPALTLLIGNPTDRFYRALRETSEALPGNPLSHRAAILRRSPTSWMESPECRLLQRVLSQSLTVDQHSFPEDFFSRYIPSVSKSEEQIASDGNHVVFGRRGAGKSSLLVYSLRSREAKNSPCVWLPMQAYDHREDIGVAAQVVRDLSEELAAKDPAGSLTRSALTSALDGLPSEPTMKELRTIVPALKTHLKATVARLGPLTIYLDDFHVLGPGVQPELLSLIYAAARGNRVYLKVSAIEQFTALWRPSERVGLETPNDAQVVRLDHNLTSPEMALNHISSILTAHANYCGIPSIGPLCPNDALARLIWVSAGVPRDAINIFIQALVEALRTKKKAVTVTSINAAAAKAADDKMRSMKIDASSAEHEKALALLEEVRQFCIEKAKKNAFLVETDGDESLDLNIRKLIDLRMLHVLHPGITPDQAGVRWQALMLDYGFYTGVRAAKSVDLFQRNARAPEVKVLRRLPRFRRAADLRPNGRTSTKSPSPKARKTVRKNLSSKVPTPSKRGSRRAK